MAVALVSSPASARERRRGGDSSAESGGSDQAAQEAAKEHFLKGQEAFNAGRYDEAMSEFGAGYAAVPRPGFILNMAHTQRAKGNLPRAKQLYLEYLEMDPGSKRKDEVKAAIAEIDAALNPDDAKPMGGLSGGSGNRRRESGADTPPPPPPAIHLAQADSDEEVPEGLQLRSRELKAEQEDAEKPFYSKWWFWTAVGVVAVGAVVAGVALTRQPFSEEGSWGSLGK